MTRLPADPALLRRHVERLEGERHWQRSPGALAAAARYVTSSLEALGWTVREQPFPYMGAEHANLLALSPGADPSVPRALVGAHLDTVVGTPGADDNGSGVAGVLEVARVLGAVPPERPVELAVWALEERTGWTYRVGSRHQVTAARSAGTRYRGAFVLEMIGYRSSEPGTQRVPLPVRWMNLPRTGDFLAVIADWGSRRLLRHFLASSARAAPELRLSHLTVPLRGWPVWATRRSDNASFWSSGFPALLLTDTANLRNPHYHRPTDRSETLDYGFMASVVDAVAEAAGGLAG